MIGTLFRLNWINLKRDRIAQALSFVLPIVFFSIFAGVFGGQGPATTRGLKIAIVDEDHSESSARLAAAVAAEQSFRVQRLVNRDPARPPDRQTARDAVTSGDLPVVLVLPKGSGETIGAFGGGGTPVELLVDSSNPMAGQMTAGLLQKVAMTAAPDLMIRRGLEQFEQYAGAMTGPQREAMDRFLPMLRESASPSASPSASAGGENPNPDRKGAGQQPASAPTPAPNPDRKGAGQQAATAGFGSPLQVKIVDVLGNTDKTPEIAFYCAGTAVMFLLFMASGAGGALLEEEENGTIERLLSSNLTMSKLLLGKWLFLALMGAIQVSIMFIWGSLVFGLKLWTPSHLAGFAVMTLVTASAAAAFGLVLATACRSRAQLGGVSTMVILIMSAVGGSMFPRFLMGETMQKIGLVTFNAWALDGYQKVFWYDKPVWTLGPQVAVLLTLTVVFLAGARLLARRWEAV